MRTPLILALLALPIPAFADAVKPDLILTCRTSLKPMKTKDEIDEARFCDVTVARWLKHCFMPYKQTDAVRWVAESAEHGSDVDILRSAIPFCQR